MPQINFSFSGWVRGANVEEVTDASGKEIDVSKMDAEELAGRLADGTYFISLGDYLYDNQVSEIELSDYQAD